MNRLNTVQKKSLEACPFRLSSLAIAIAFATSSVAFAQTSPAPAVTTTPASAEAATDPNDQLQMEKVFVTGTSTARTKMKQSVSVSTISSDQIQNSKAASTVEILRAVPGLRAESTGGEGNANLGVRGLPMSDGGGRYVQLQEDGLPVLLIGDISFATADQFLRSGYWTDSIDVIRGGSSSTLSTNSPGAIVNFISKTGKEPGGAFGLTFGAGHSQQRGDFDYGAALGNGMYFHVGGYYRIGEGARNTNVNVENGGLVRASLTKDFGKDGYIRFYLKHLADKTPTYLPVPVRLNGTTIEPINGIDPRSAFFIGSNFPTDTVVDRNGNRVTTKPGDGLNVNVSSFGFEGQMNLGNDLTLTNRFRKSAISGRFVGVFPAGSQPIGGATNYSGATPVFSAHMFNTELDDMGNMFNDLRLQKVFNLDKNSRLTVTGGLFFGNQTVAETWYWNRYNVELTGNNPRLFNNAGAVTTSPVADATTTWGGCCFRSIDVSINALAPYLAATWDMGPLSLDASVRSDRQKATGSQRFGDTASGGNWNASRTSAVGYDTSASSYSVGGNYEFSRGLSAFARASSGASWKSPDRVIWDTDVSSGKTPYPVNRVNQFEAGVKTRNGPFSAFVTFFAAKTKEGAGYELTTQTIKNDSYSSNGLEAELGWRSGPFRIQGGATLTNAKLTSGENIGKTPRRQAKFIYQVSPSYSFGDFDFGGSLIGTTKSFAQNDNQAVLPAYAVINLFANYQVTKSLSVNFGVNNLLNKVGYTEAEGQGNLNGNSLYIARSINGRTANLGLKVSF
jgi:outer membrane receptor protein involved in Fe transport